MIRTTKPQLLKKTKVPVEGLFCNYSHRTCMLNRLEGFEFCIKHILEDKTAPFKQCAYVSSKTAKRCTYAAPKADRKDGYCPEHAKRALLMRQKASRKKRPKETAESIIEEIEQRFAAADSTEIIVKQSRIPADSLANKVLEYATSSDSDDDIAVTGRTWHGDGDSDAESVDSEQEDPLKHAGVHTSEEVALIMRDKLIRLQSLYIDQFKRLQHVLKEKRRKYLHSVRHEKDHLGGLRMYKDHPEYKDQYMKLKAVKRYHKRYGKEALLHRQSKQRRIEVSEGVNYRPPSYPKCQHVENGSKCYFRTVPLSKFCLEHIKNDTSQVLFRQCTFAEGSCEKQVFSLSEPYRCPLHMTLTETLPRVSSVQLRAPTEKVLPIEEINPVGSIAQAAMDTNFPTELTDDVPIFDFTSETPGDLKLTTDDDTEPKECDTTVDEQDDNRMKYSSLPNIPEIQNTQL